MRKRVPREYQELFCVGELTEMEKRLYGGDPYRERVGGMHYCTKTEKAGDTLVLTVYPILGRSDRAKAEAARKAMSRERQNRYNRERARRRLALLMDANFGKNDLHVTLTYRGTPPDYEQARKDVRNYLRAVKRMREKAGLPDMSNARVRRLCQEMPGNAAEIMGKLYPAYKLGAVEPYVSDWIPGVYLRIRLRRRCP